jgi:peptide/nickel transport system substrate-binding protein
MSMHKVLRALGLVLVGAVLVSAGVPADPASAAAPPASLGKVVIAPGVDTNTMDPAITNARASSIIVENMFDSLLWRDPKTNALIPHLAESYKVSDDGLIWTVKLRKDVKFWNGDPLTSADVKFSIGRIQDPAMKSQYRPHLVDIKQVNTPDPYTVEIVMAKPNPILPAYFVQTIKIVPMKYIQQVGNDQFARKPVGSGPFKFVEWVKDDHLTLAANKDFFLGAPKIETLVFRPIPEASTRLAELLSGNVDVITNVPPQMIAQINANPATATGSVGTSRQVFVTLRTEVKPLDDVRVRQAINYAVDIDAIIKNVLGGNGTRVAAAVPFHTFGVDPTLKPYPYDPQKAKALLTEAGYGNGFTIDLDSPSGRYLKDKEVAQAIAGYLAKVGIKVNVIVKEWGLYSDQVDKRLASPMFLIGWGGGGTFEADTTLNTQLRSTDYHSFYYNKELDKLLDIARTTFNTQKRLDAYKQAQAIIYRDAPWLFLWVETATWGMNKRVDWKPRPDEAIWGFDAALGK